MLLPQTMLSSSSKELPQTMLSSSPKLFPQTMLSSSPPRPSPQTMLRAHAGRCSVISVSPIDATSAPDDRLRPGVGMAADGGRRRQRRREPWSADRRLRIDGPRQRDRASRLQSGRHPARAHRIGCRLRRAPESTVYSRTAFTAFGVRSRLACSTSATTPLATPAAMLVPERRM